MTAQKHIDKSFCLIYNKIQNIFVYIYCVRAYGTFGSLYEVAIMKKIISAILILVTVMSLMLVFTSCGKDDITKDLKFELLDDDTYAVVGFDGDETDIEIPSEYQGKAVTVIGSEAFKEKKIEKIVLPDSVKTIKNNAFYRCDAMTEITLGDSVESIGMAAFFGCSKLEKINLPQSVKFIGGYAFQACGSLSEIVLPSGVEIIYADTFMGCTKLKKVTVENFKLFENINKEDDVGSIIRYADIIYINDTASKFGDYITKNFNRVASENDSYIKLVRNNEE